MARTKPDKKGYQPPKEILPIHQEFMAKVGNKLKELRMNKQVSISELCRQVGGSRNAYTAMEKGRGYFSTLKFLQTLDFLGCPPEEFFKSL